MSGATLAKMYICLILAGLLGAIGAQGKWTLHMFKVAWSALSRWALFHREYKINVGPGLVYILKLNI